MTGYAAVRRSTTSGELSVSLRAVNHRALDLHFHMPSDLYPFENAVRSLLKQHIERGHVEIRIGFKNEPDAASADFDTAVLAGYVNAFRQACRELEMDSKPDLNVLLTLPGVLNSARESTSDSTLEPELLAGMADCLREFNAHREREGRELVSHIERELAEMEQSATQLSAIRSQAIPHFKERLQARISELLAGSEIPEMRLAQEAALLADKSDIEEEITRLTIHAQELRRVLDAGGAVGKRLDFLVQEMNRETNTILSKASGIGESGLPIASLGLGIKANIERIREQALNLE